MKKLVKNLYTVENLPALSNLFIRNYCFAALFLKKTRFLFFIFIPLSLLFILPTQLQAANMTITNYYPSLSGKYAQFRLLPRADLSDPCIIGAMYVNSTNELRYCRDNGGVGTWGPITDVWTQSGDNFYPTDTLTEPNLHVGIGTKTPEFKLSIQNDAGIIAQGTFDSGAILPGLGASSRLIWYPRKAAFRAGHVDGNQWDDANTGNYSSAFGKNSTASGDYSVVGGGDSNTSSGNYSNVIGGQNNTASGDYSAIIGGDSNTATQQYATVTGGQSNSAIANFATVLGGQNNQAVALYSTIGGGANNQILTPYSNINGGKDHRITGTLGYSVIGGGLNNQITADYGVISGGENNTVYDSYASIGGGKNNEAGAGGSPSYARVSGGQTNRATAPYSTISGGKENTTLGSYSTIGGGWQNTASADYSVVAGGERNTASGLSSIILGGTDNLAAGDYSWANGRNIRINATADRTFAWGYSDTPVDIDFSDAFIIAPGTIAGYPWHPKVGIRDINPVGVLEINANAATDDYITIKRNTAGDTFIIKNNGYVGVNKATPTVATHAMQFGNANNAYLSGGGVWTNGSSRKTKENIAPLTSQTARNTLKKLNPVTFKYKVNHHSNAGFIAEDVPDIVAMPDRKSLSSMDIIAILTKVSQDQENRIKTQANRIKAIQEEINTLKEFLDK